MVALFGTVSSQLFLQSCIDGLSTGALIALVALGYTMVYGIVELINFAHGDVFMLGTFFSLTLYMILDSFGLNASLGPVPVIALMLLTTPIFCAILNWSIDRAIYKPLRDAPKLAPLVSAIGVSFVFMNLGMFWNGAIPDRAPDGSAVKVQASSDRSFPALLPDRNLLGEGSSLQFRLKDAVVVATTLPIMIGLYLLVKFTSIGKAMRATAQNPTAAKLMGIPTDRVVGATFLLGGGLGGVASVVYALTYTTLNYQLGTQNGLYAFTAAVLGGIGNIPGAVLGGLLIGMVRSMGSAVIGEKWTSALVFVVLIVVLIFRPTGILGSRTREKV